VTKRILVIVLKYGLGLGLLAAVVFLNWHKTSPAGEEVGLAAALEKPMNVGALLFAAAICSACVLLTFIRWYILVRAQDLPFTLPSAFRLGLIGFFFNTMLPGGVGGDLIKAACIAREQSRRTVSVATIILDRAVGLVGLVWLAFLLGGLFWATGLLPTLVQTEGALAVVEAITLGSAVLFCGSILLWIVLGFLPAPRSEAFALRLQRVPKIGWPLAELWRAVWMYRCRGRSVALALAIAIIAHFGFVLTFFFAALTLTPLDQIPSAGTHFLLVPVGMVIQNMFPSPGGVGGGEFGFGTLYELFGFAFAFGVLGSLVFRAISWMLGLIGYLVYLRMRPSLQSASRFPQKELALTADV
jgi:uncharacterized membrane protein YbhN (UPF0104 family)